MQVLIKVLRRMPLDRASELGGALGRAIGPRLGISRRARANLRACLGDRTDSEIAGIIRDMWDNLGRTAFEYAHLARFRFYEKDSRIEVRGMEHVDQVIASGRGAIFVSGHFGNWELLSAGLVQRGLPVMTVYRAASNPLADDIIVRMRADTGTPHQAPKGAAGARMLFSWLRGKNYVAMLVDQKMNDGIAAPFFGRPAMSPPAAAQLARRFGCPIVFASMRRTQGAHFIIEVEKPFFVRSSGDKAEDIQVAVNETNRRLEAFIRKYPAQWLWLHRRWPD